MNKLDPADVLQYVECHIGEFHSKRVETLDGLQLNKVLRRKNPYLFRSKHMLTAEAIVRGLTDAHVSSNEETIFGTWLEGLAIFVCGKVYGGQKSGITGVDLEFNKDGRRQIVAIKSGPNWGNSSQIRRMVDDFRAARKTLRTSNSNLDVVAVNGCCYGIDNKPDKGDYFKYCGQRFWRFISGEDQLFTDIIEPLGHKAKENNEKFSSAYAKVVNRFTREFTDNYCRMDGGIDWKELVRFNSSMR